MSNKCNDMCMRNPERTDQECYEFRENVVCGNEGASLLPGTTIDGCRTVVICLCGVNKMSPSRSVYKDIRHQDGLWMPQESWSPAWPSPDKHHADQPSRYYGCGRH